MISKLCGLQPFSIGCGVVILWNACDFQARTHQLLIHNKELLDHLQTLVRHIQELESVTGHKERSGSTQNSIAAATATGVTLPQVKWMHKRNEIEPVLFGLSSVDCMVFMVRFPLPIYFLV